MSILTPSFHDRRTVLHHVPCRASAKRKTLRNHGPQSARDPPLGCGLPQQARHQNSSLNINAPVKTVATHVNHLNITTSPVKALKINAPVRTVATDVCTYTYTYTCIYIFTHMYTQLHTHIPLHIHIRVDLLRLDLLFFSSAPISPL